MTTEFDDADGEVTVLEPEVESRQMVKRQSELPSTNVVQYRDSLVRQYHKGAPSLTDRLRKSGREGYESLIVALIDEVITETDHLLGNELVATENGELRDASIISFKRAEVLEKAIKAVQLKQQGERTSGVDIDSPAMTEVFRFFMMKVRETMVRAGAKDEFNDLFFRTFTTEMVNWKRELRERFEALSAKAV